jgi:hypothetical protein
MIALLGACAPLTFSERPALDYSRYRSVRVEVNPSYGDPGYATNYFAEQLRNGSGFEQVTTDAAARTDLVITVQVSVSSSTDTDGNIEYDGTADYVARSPDGRVIDEGSADDTSQSPDEVVEDVLDEVALHYIAPFRL